jgi:hypothetical protein
MAGPLPRSLEHTFRVMARRQRISHSDGMYDRDADAKRRSEGADGGSAGMPGKKTLAERVSVQRRAAPSAAGSLPPPSADYADPFWFAPVQALEGQTHGEAAEVATIATAGVAGASSPLPFHDTIQRSFGDHDVSGVRAQVGGAGGEAAAAIGATAYATGDRVAFAGAPDLFTAAHEAAHVVQQRAGVHLRSADPDGGEPTWLEDHADQVAARVVRGESAAPLLDEVARPGQVGGAAGVQRMKVFRGKAGDWRLPVSKKETGAELTDLDDLSKFSNKLFFVETDNLPPKERERLIEIIAKAGHGDIARAVRAEIGGSIYVEAAEVNGTMERVAELLGPLTDGVEVRLVPDLIAQLQDLAKTLAGHGQRVIINARDLGTRAGIIKRLEGDQLDLDAAIEQLTAAVEKGDPPETLVKYERKTLKRKQALAQARQIKETQAYADLTDGKQWQREGLDDKVERPKSELPLSPEQDQELRAQQIWELSKKNLERLKSQVNLDGPAGELYGRLITLPWVLKHATGAFNAIVNSGVLSSLTELRAEGSGQKASGMSSDKNIENKGDGGFAFFRMDANNDPMETRYGPTTILADASLLTEANGWVSLHDQLVPLDRPAMKRLMFQGQVQRTSEHDPQHLGTGKQTSWTNTYPMNEQQPPVEVSFLDEVFCGADVLPGIALSVLLELQRIGGKFQEHAYQLTEDKDLRALVASLFRVEAKLPWSWQLDEHAHTAVHNPDGDGRYLRSGIIHPEGMAAGAAFDECKRYQTMIDNVLVAVAKAEELPKQLVEQRKLIGFLREMVGKRVRAHELAIVFQAAARRELQAEETDENTARVEVATRVVGQRAQQLAEEQQNLSRAEYALEELPRRHHENQRLGPKAERYRALRDKLELAKMAEREDTLENNDEWAEDDEYLSPEEALELAGYKKVLAED